MQLAVVYTQTCLYEMPSPGVQNLTDDDSLLHCDLQVVTPDAAGVVAGERSNLPLGCRGQQQQAQQAALYQQQQVQATCCGILWLYPSSWHSSQRLILQSASMPGKTSRP